VLCDKDNEDDEGDDEDHEDGTAGKHKIDSLNTARIPGQTEEPQAVTFLEVISFCA
jgi:hypothetical protein